MDKFFTKWQWKWPENESTKEILYMFENEHKMVLEIKEKRSNEEKYCEWMSFNKMTREIEILQFKAMGEKKRQFIGDITLEWDKTKSLMRRENVKEVFEVKISK